MLAQVHTATTVGAVTAPAGASVSEPEVSPTDEEIGRVGNAAEDALREFGPFAAAREARV